VLWLLEAHRTANDNLKREAQRHGVDPARLVFTPRVSPEQYLARMRASDLFLDTFPYNAHVTCADALWVGLPVLTRSGDTFASRVAGSLLGNVGLPEMIASSIADYEASAIRLARSPRELAALRAKLARNQPGARLFDTQALARDIEAAYRAMQDIRLAGERPRPIDL
jgi:protein O-GlcNAc transferase